MFFVDISAYNEFQQVGAKKSKEDEDTESKYSMEDGEDTNENPSTQDNTDDSNGYSMDAADDDTPNDYSMGNAEKDGEEFTPTDPETPEDGNTGDGDELGDGSIPDDGDADDTSDYSMDGAEDDTGDGSDDTTDDDSSDYSMDGADDGTGDTTGDTSTDDLGGGDGSIGDEQQEDPDQRIKEIEASINSSLNPQDLKNRDKKLKLTFVDTYKLTTDLIDKIQDLPKNEDNNDEIDWLVGQASRLKGIIYDYIINNFDNKEYIQNLAVHSKYLVTLTGIKKILQQLKPKKEK